MKFKTLLNGAILFIGLGLAAYSQLNKENQQSPSAVVPVTPEREFERGSLGGKAAQRQVSFERWNLKPGSVYDGDKLRVVRGNEELKIRFCGINAPEKQMLMGIESRDYLRSLIRNHNFPNHPSRSVTFNRTV